MLLTHYMRVYGAPFIVTKGWLLCAYFQFTLSIVNRSDMTVSLEDSKIKKRTLSSLKDRCTKSDVHQRLGCIHEPLFDIELDHVIVDELHLLLRITDRLISALINRMAQLDTRSRLFKEGQPNNMIQLVSAINSCGVPFKVRKR